MTPQQQEELERIKDIARQDHERKRRAAKARGRVDFPLLPYECSWAFEEEFKRETAKGKTYSSAFQFWSKN